MSRTIEQIAAEVNAQSDPQRKLILNQIANVPNEVKADEQQLNAQLDTANKDIMLDARRRGVGYWSAPSSQQQMYAVNEYAPALARARAAGTQRKSALESALLDIGRENYNTAYGIYNQDRSFEEQQRQFNEQMAYNREQAARQAAAEQSNYQGVIEGLNAKIAALLGGGGQGGVRQNSVGTENLVQAANNRNTYLDQNTGRLVYRSQLPNGGSVYTGGY